MLKFQTIGQLEEQTIEQLRALREQVINEQLNYPRQSLESLYLFGLQQNIDAVILEKLNQPIPLTKVEITYTLR